MIWSAADNEMYVDMWMILRNIVCYRWTFCLRILYNMIRWNCCLLDSI